MSTTLALLRRNAERVCRRARWLRIDEDALRAEAAELAALLPAGLEPDPDIHYLRAGAGTLAFLLALDAINFGSGWFPHWREPEGRSLYRSVAQRLTEDARRYGPPTARWLAGVGPIDCARIEALVRTALDDSTWKRTAAAGQAMDYPTVLALARRA